ncbi:unnamed protein product [Gongylonema pulchrum]|uniref:PH domain-containing protein n=1 Tax=Gongylonema pulchrum TaxID=637853 RepID=A0A183DR21_9BILA|nr:unnamed protein product [Gongylonema pulchrum]
MEKSWQETRSHWMEKMAKQHEKLRPTAELLYTPRKCDSTSRILGPRDYDSIMITFAPLPGELPPKMLPRIMGPLLVGDCISYAISGKVRRMGESNDCINRLATHDGILMLNPIPKYKIEYEVPLQPGLIVPSHVEPETVL